MGTGNLPDRPVIIAFDDGYLDIAEHALPILQRYRYPAAIFLVTSLIGKSSEWDRANGFAPLPLMTRDQILTGISAASSSARIRARISI